MTERFTFELNLKINRLDGHITVEDPTFLSEKMLDRAWQLMSDFVIDLLDSKSEEATDERFRELFIEVCYRIIYRELFTLSVMPLSEKSGLQRLGTGKTGPKALQRKKGSYDDDWNW